MDQNQKRGTSVGYENFNQKPTTPTQKTTIKPPQPKTKTNDPVSYKYAGKETIAQIIKKAFPKEFRPTKKTEQIFGGIFLIVLVIALIQFPFGSLFSGDTSVSVKIGFPWTFLELKMLDADESPLRIGGLFLDLILYAIIAYAIDIIINLIASNPIIQSKEEKKKYPKIFKDQKSKSISESLTKKIAEKQNSKIPKPQTKQTISQYKI